MLSRLTSQLFKQNQTSQETREHKRNALYRVVCTEKLYKLQKNYKLWNNKTTNCSGEVEKQAEMVEMVEKLVSW